MVYLCVKPEINVRCLPQFLLHIIFEIGSMRGMFILKMKYEDVHLPTRLCSSTALAMKY